MPIRIYKPTSAGRRQMSVVDLSELARKRPEASLVTGRTPQRGGRNTHGHTTTRFQGGGHKRLYRRIDFRRDKLGIPARVAAIEYDPNRSANLALLHYADGDKRYILHPVGLEVGATVSTGEAADILPGNALKIRNIPPGTMLHNLELYPGRGGQVVRSAGASAQLLSKEGDLALIKLP